MVNIEGVKALVKQCNPKASDKIAPVLHDILTEVINLTGLNYRVEVTGRLEYTLNPSFDHTIPVNVFTIRLPRVLSDTMLEALNTVVSRIRENVTADIPHYGHEVGMHLVMQVEFEGEKRRMRNEG